MAGLFMVCTCSSVILKFSGRDFLVDELLIVMSWVENRCGKGVVILLNMA